jgi:hypothetical protein
MHAKVVLVPLSSAEALIDYDYDQYSDTFH